MVRERDGCEIRTILAMALKEASHGGLDKFMQLTSWVFFGVALEDGSVQ